MFHCHSDQGHHLGLRGHLSRVQSRAVLQALNAALGPPRRLILMPRQHFDLCFDFFSSRKKRKTNVFLMLMIYF